MPHSVLLVDDDVTFSQIICDLLRKEGFHVYASHSANHGYRTLYEHPDIEVMLLDWSMPGVTGIEFLRQIKQGREFEDLAVIMQTVMGNAENIQEGIEAGAFFYLVKPVKKELLFSTIRMAIADHERKKDLYRKLKESENSFRFLEEGTFRFKTIAEGDYLAVRIANLCKQPEEAMYITELFSNAVEHGNLGLTYHEKSDLVQRGRLGEEMQHRLSFSENMKKEVKVTLKRNGGNIIVTISDAGNGFDFKKFMNFDDERFLDNHGRGIAIAKTFLNIEFLGNGNTVKVTIPAAGQHKAENQTGAAS